MKIVRNRPASRSGFPLIRGVAEQKTGHFRLPGAIRADLGPFSRDCLAAFSERTGLAIEAGAPWLRLKKEDLPEEGYRLLVEESHVAIDASSEEGIIHALTTLFLRLEAGQIACCRLEDQPKHPHRGLSLDCVRHFFPIGEVEKILEQMALVKMNVLHFHLSDDQGWRIESLRFPQLHQQSGEYYTRRELKDLVEFARVRGIRVIPEIDLPGHTTAIIAAYPEMSCSGEPVQVGVGGGIYSRILCGGDEKVYEFLYELLDEVLPMVTTDMSNGEILGYAAKVFPMFSKATISSQRVPADGAYKGVMIDGMSVLVADMDLTRQMLQETLAD